jgi:hypothetical protein
MDEVMTIYQISPNFHHSKSASNWRCTGFGFWMCFGKTGGLGKWQHSGRFQILTGTETALSMYFLHQ